MTNMANHPNLDPEWLQAIGDTKVRETLAAAIAAFPALHPTWQIEALESTRGRYALANHLIDALRVVSSGPVAQQTETERKTDG